MKLEIRQLPAPPPPAVYSLLNLDAHEMAIIYALIGANCGSVSNEILKEAGLPPDKDVNRRLFNQLSAYRDSVKGASGCYAVKVITQEHYRELTLKD